MNIRNIILPLIAIAGIGYGVYYAVATSTPAKVVEKPAALPPANNYPNAISGSGLIEANTRNISVGSQFSGVVSEVFVTDGELVTKGAPLFRLDDRSVKSTIATAMSEVSTSEAEVAQAEVAIADQRDLLGRYEKMIAGNAISVNQLTRQRFAMRTAEVKLAVARANVEAAKARLEAAKTNLSQLTVRAPITGRILKLYIRAGEFIDASSSAQTSLVIGNDTPLHVRVSLDENDLWRFRKEAHATGALRSNRDVTFPLTFVRIEPYVGPKLSLTGSTSERVDTRVMEVVYSIEPTALPVYIGQQVDVFIDTTPLEKTAAPVRQ